jgi:hypothetical protein
VRGQGIASPTGDRRVGGRDEEGDGGRRSRGIGGREVRAGRYDTAQRRAQRVGRTEEGLTSFTKNKLVMRNELKKPCCKGEDQSFE